MLSFLWLSNMQYFRDEWDRWSPASGFLLLNSNSRAVPHMMGFHEQIVKWNELHFSWMALACELFLLEQGLSLQMEEIVCFYINLPLCCLCLQSWKEAEACIHTDIHGSCRAFQTHTKTHTQTGENNWYLDASEFSLAWLSNNSQKSLTGIEMVPQSLSAS